MKRISIMPGIGHIYDLGELIAAGPITHQPESVVFRVVLLYNSKSEWVVYFEQWLRPQYDTEGNLAMNMDMSHMNDGFYTTDFVKAMDKFCQRLNKPEQYRSLSRDNGDKNEAKAENIPAG